MNVYSTEKELNVSDLKEAGPGEVFAGGITTIIHPYWDDVDPGILEEDGRSTKVKWVAVRGKGFHDWAIYHSLDANLCRARYFNSLDHLFASDTSIARGGAKLHDEQKVKELVPCSMAAFALYRH